MDSILFNGCNLIVLLFVLILKLALICPFHEGVIGAGLAHPPQATRTLDTTDKTTFSGT